KKLTGGGPVRARRMRQDFYEWEGTHKLMIVGNYRPRLRNVDEAMRRRILLIPFEVEIPDDEKDKDLSYKLEAEYAQLLGWILKGTQEYMAHGLNPPERVRAATEEYLSNADTFTTWLEDMCVLGANEGVSKGDLFIAWRLWAERAHEYVGAQRGLGEKVLERV